MGKNKSNGISSISRSANILLCLSNSMNSVTEIAKYCNYNKPTVHRLLKALEAADLVIQDPVNRRYYLGKLIPIIALHSQNIHHHLISCSIVEMMRLSEKYDENVLLGIHSGIQFIRLYSIPSRQELIGGEQILESGPPWYAGGTGRILLSQHKDAELAMLVANLEMRKMTKHTITNKDEFLNRIKLVRQRGYDVSYSEVVEGIGGVVIPIKNYYCPAALCIIGPDSRIKQNENEILKDLRISGKNISNQLSLSLELVQHSKKEKQND